MNFTQEFSDILTIEFPFADNVKNVTINITLVDGDGASSLHWLTF